MEDLKVTHQAPFSFVECFVLANGRTDVQTPWMKIMTIYLAVGVLWVNEEEEEQHKAFF